MIAVFALNSNDERIRSVAQRLQILMSEYQMPFMLHEKLESIVTKENTNFFHGFYNSLENIPDIEFLISIGGDGSFLHAMRLAGRLPVKLLGINAGRLGFLSNVPPDKLETVLAWLKKGKYRIDYRSILKLQAETPIIPHEPIALNDIVVHKNDSSSMIAIHTYLNGEFLNTYWADGLIVSTPTGSTGYSLSCGGPILYPSAKSLVITPIAPHNLNLRPLVIPDDQVIAFEVESRNGKFMLSLDSFSTAVSDTCQFAIGKANHQIALLSFEALDYIHTLRDKLMWGMDNRNYKN